MSAEQIAAITQAVVAALGATGNQMPNLAPQMQPTENFPIGVTGRDHRGVMISESVDDLYTWDNHVQAKNGGTFRGSKVLWIKTEKLVKNAKTRSVREQWMATFNVSRPEGRNVINELVNIFIKNELDYRPYLTPEKWSFEEVVIDFISEDEEEKPRKVRIKIHAFDGVPVSDNVRAKCRYIMGTKDYAGTMYQPFINGVQVDID